MKYTYNVQIKKVNQDTSWITMRVYGENEEEARKRVKELKPELIDYILTEITEERE